MATFKTPQWFETTRGLRNNGLDVLSLSNRDVSKDELAHAFGPKSSKNGWRYDHRLTSEAAREVEELYCRVTSKNKITNNELTLQFARGLLLEGKGVEVNWAAFAAHLHSHREKVCSAKAGKQGSSGVPLPPGNVPAIRSSVVARASSSTPSSGIPPFPIRAQSEVRMGRGKMTLAKALTPPNWSLGNIDDMRATLASKKQLCASLREKAEVLKLKGEEKHTGAQRSQLLLSQHEAIYNAALCEFEKSDVKVLAAKALVQNLETGLQDLSEKRSACLEIGYIGTDIGQFDSEIGQKNDALRLASETLKELECQRACEMMTERYAAEKLRVTKEESDALHDGQSSDGKDYRSILVTIKSLESLLPTFEQQILRMEKGGGAILYPQPLSSHPDYPKETISILNPCPVCNLWYECHEHLAASCGHTYHPWCFTEHARNSLACLVPDCGEDFDIKCLTAWGIRPSHGEHVRTPTKIALNNISTQSGEHTLHIFVVFYVFISCLLKYITYIPSQTRCCTSPIFLCMRKSFPCVLHARTKVPFLT